VCLVDLTNLVYAMADKRLGSRTPSTRCLKMVVSVGSTSLALAKRHGTLTNRRIFALRAAQLRNLLTQPLHSSAHTQNENKEP
jgi:hypothetical protein